MHAKTIYSMKRIYYNDADRSKYTNRLSVFIRVLSKLAVNDQPSIAFS